MSKRHNPQYDLLIQNAIENIETLLEHVKVPYQKASGHEIDILATWRGDSSFGSCRFNTTKGIGSDFARDVRLTPEMQKMFGNGFTRSDFQRESFNIIGLWIRIYELDAQSDYHLAAKLLEDDLKAIGAECNKEELAARAKYRTDVEAQRAQARYERAVGLWMAGQDIKGSNGEIYLNARGIYLSKFDEFGVDMNADEPNIRFIPRSWDDEPKPNGASRPTIVFKISDSPSGKLRAIQRIFLSSDHKRKADIPNPKKTLVADIKGNAIWFGKISTDLYVAEGPENALSLRYVFGATHVISTVNLANMPSAPIPKYVKRVIICPDRKKDENGNRPGIVAAEKLAERVSAKGLYVKIVAPPAVVSDDNDWNDIAQVIAQGDKAELLQMCRNMLELA